MFIWLSLVASLAVNSESLGRVYNATASLHKRTKFRTLYELFDLREKASFRDVQRSYHRMVSSGRLSDDTHIDEAMRRVISEAYDVFRRYKAAYDYLLDHPYLMKEPVRASRTETLAIVLVGAALVVLADFAIASARILLHRKGTRKDRRKSKKTQGIEPSLKDMGIARLYRYVTRRR